MKNLFRALVAVVIFAVLGGLLTPQVATASAPPSVAQSEPVNELPDSVHEVPEERVSPEPPEPEPIPADSALAKRREELRTFAEKEIAEVDAHDSKLVVETPTIEAVVEEAPPAALELNTESPEDEPGPVVEQPEDGGEATPPQNPSPAPSVAPVPSATPAPSPSPSPSPETVPSASAPWRAGNSVASPALAAFAGPVVRAAIPTGNACFPGDAPTHNATVDVHSVAQTIMHNRQGRITVTVTNTGKTAWPAGTYLSYRLFNSERNQVGGYGATTPLDAMASGAAKKLDAAAGPISPGSWFLLWDINVPSIGWLGDRGVCPLMTLEVPNQRPSISLVSPRLADIVSTRTPYLTVAGSDVDAWPTPSSLKYEFRVCANVELTVGCHTSGQVTGGSWRVPDLALQWDGTYFWNATVSDGLASISLRDGTDPALLRFKVVVPQPDSWRQVGNGVGLTNVHGLVLPYGVFIHTERDAQVNTPNLPLFLERTYSSGATATEGAFGKGWMSALDASAVRNPSTRNITVTYADGRQEVFGELNGGYIGATHLGMQNKLIRSSDGSIKVTQMSGEVLSFDGAGKLLKIEYPGTGSWDFGYTGGLVSTITQKPSGTQMKFNWARVETTCAAAHRPTKPYVTGVSIARGDGNPDATWSYRYGCDELSAVTPPTGGTKSYSSYDTNFYPYSPEGHSLPGLVRIGEWTNVRDSHRERSIVLRQPGSPDRTVRLLSAPTTGSTEEYRNQYNPMGGMTALYCETRVVENATEKCNEKYDTFRFDETGRLRYKNNQYEGQALASVPYRYWYYDSTGRLQSIEDENGNVRDFSYDAYGNLSTSRAYRNQGSVSEIASSSFYKNVSPNPADALTRLAGVHVSPENSGTHLGEFANMFHYDSQGRLIRRNGPATPGDADGEDVVYTYTTGSEPAVDANGAPVSGQTAPPGLLRTEVTDAGTTAYSYDSRGNMTRVAERAGLTTLRAYDARGLVLSELKSGPGVIRRVTFTYDAAGRMTRERRPCAQNAVTSEFSQLIIDYTYDRDGLLTKETKRAVQCDTDTDVLPARATVYIYTSQGVLKQVTSPSGATTKYTYTASDPTKVATMEDARGRVTSYTYNAEGRLRYVAADTGMRGSGERGHLVEYGYDRAGRLNYEYDAVGRITYYDYTADDLAYRARRPVGTAANGSTIFATMWERQFDGRGQITLETVGNRAVASKYDSEGRLYASTLDPAGLNRTTTTRRDGAGRIVEIKLSDATRTERTTYDVDPAGFPIATHRWVDDVSLTTLERRNAEGVTVSVKDPRFSEPGSGPLDFTSTIGFDVEGRPTVTTGPIVTVESPSNTDAIDASAYGAPVTTSARRETRTGYNAFGDVVSVRDNSARATTYEYDAGGRLIAERAPAFTNPNGSTETPVIRYEHNSAGDVIKKVNAKGRVTDYEFDVAGNLVKETGPELSWIERPVATFTYDSTGQLKTKTTPTGAVTVYSYDSFGRVVAVTAKEREGTVTRDYITSYTYNQAGALTAMTTPAGRVTRYGRNAAGEATAIWYPGRSQPDRFQYDLAGRVTLQTDGAGRKLEHVYDTAGRKTSSTRIGTDGTRLTTTFEYDRADNLVATTNPREVTTTYTVNAANLRTRVTQPVTFDKVVTSEAGYDVFGNRVRTRNGKGADTWTVFDSWDRPQKIVEPATAAHPGLADRSWSFQRDTNGNVDLETRPGGLEVMRNFDALDRTMAETASSTRAGGPSHEYRRFYYDLDGRLTATSHPSDVLKYTWSDRGLLKVSEDPEGRIMAFGHDADGNVVERATGGSKQLFTYDSGGRLSTSTGGPTGSTSWTYDAASGDATGHATTGARIVRSYDPHGRVAAIDARVRSTGASLQNTTYGYDSNDNVVTKTVTGGVQGGGTYQYDRADRPIGWQPRDTSTAVGSYYSRAYAWDDANNLVQETVNVSRQDWKYDARGRLTERVDDFDYGPTHVTSVESDAAGSIVGTDTRAGSTLLRSRDLRYDAFGQLVGDGDTEYAYDGLGRLTSVEGRTDLFWHADLDIEPEVVADIQFDDAEAIFRTPGGEPIASSGVYGARAMVSDAHMDVTGGVEKLTTAPVMAGRAQFDPFGEVFHGAQWRTGGSAQRSSLGFQSDWTNFGTGASWAGARWYDADLRGFLSRDSTVFPLAGQSSLNMYGYGNANPLNRTDSTGRFIDQLVRDVGTNLGRAADDFWTPDRRARLDALGREFIGDSPEKAAVKVGGRVTSRLLPGIGWALFAVDIGVAINIWFGPPPGPPGPPGGGGGGGRTGDRTSNKKTTTTTTTGSPETGGTPETGGKPPPEPPGPPPPRPPDPTVQFDRPGARVPVNQEAGSSGVVTTPSPDDAGGTLPPCGLANTTTSCLAPSLGVAVSCASQTSGMGLCLPTEPVAGKPGSSGTSQNTTSTGGSQPRPTTPATATGGSGKGSEPPPPSSSDSCEPEAEGESDALHGNSANSAKLAYLYRLSTNTGSYLKTGISQNPFSRYTQGFMLDKQLDVLTKGSRREMLNLERFIVERDPGPLNRERFAGRSLDDVPGGSAEC